MHPSHVGLSLYRDIHEGQDKKGKGHARMKEIADSMDLKKVDGRKRLAMPKKHPQMQ